MRGLAQLGDPAASEAFLERYLAEKNGHRVIVERPATEHLRCGHSEDHAYRYEGSLLCRKCRTIRRYDAHRQQYLPEAIASTKRKMEALEREAKRRGVIL